MPNLEVAIDRIHQWMRDNAPHREALLQPPLTRQQIDDRVGTAGITLPREAYTLYEWRNGLANGECLFPGYRFTPLDEAAEYTLSHWRDGSLRGPDAHSWLFVFQVYGTWGGYALLCDTQPRETSAVDYDGADAATDTLADLAGMIADQFEAGSVVADDDEELEFADDSVRIGLDPEACYRHVLEGDWETMSQAVLRIGFRTVAQRHTELAVDHSLRMFGNPSSRIWHEPLILKDFMINLNFSTSEQAQAMMALLLQHSDRLVRWRAARLVGNSQYFHKYDWVRVLGDHFAAELAKPELPPPFRDDLILAFGKTGNVRAVSLLTELKKQRRDMAGVVAGMCLERVYGISG